jgi:co-chaperonin GroES (HSP10)
MLQSTKNGIRELIVVGDRVLIKPDQPEERTEVGLYLPQTVVEKEKVQAGRIVSVGPGIPIPDPGSEEEEPWKPSTR